MKERAVAQAGQPSHRNNPGQGKSKGKAEPGELTRRQLPPKLLTLAVDVHQSLELCPPAADKAWRVVDGACAGFPRTAGSTPGAAQPLGSKWGEGRSAQPAPSGLAAARQLGTPAPT